MDDSIFMEASARTVSDKFFPPGVSDLVVRQVLLQSIKSAQMLDLLKKAIFYGKSSPELAKLEPQYNTMRAEPMSYLSNNNDSSTLDRDVIDIIHGIFGMVTEAGELLEALVAYLSGESDSLDVTNLVEELGDSEWYSAMIHRATGTSSSLCRLTVINKLRKRYPDKFTMENAIVRDLVGERAVLEESVTQ